MSAPARAWAVTLALAVLVVSPLALPRGWDSFPISSYPMFSRGDLGTVVTVSHVLLVGAEGSGGRAGPRRPAPPSMVGTPEVMVAKGIVEAAIASGRAATLCGRVAARARAEDTEVRRVEVVTSTFDTRRYFAESTEPSARVVHASCRVTP